MNNFKLSPSDLTFMWDECKHFYLKAVHGFNRPSAPFPTISATLCDPANNPEGNKKAGCRDNVDLVQGDNSPC